MPFSRQLGLVAFLPLAVCAAEGCGTDALSAEPTDAEPRDAQPKDASPPDQNTSVDAPGEDRDVSIEPTDDRPSTRDSQSEMEDVSHDGNPDEDTGDIGMVEIGDISNDSTSVDVQDVGLTDATSQYCTDQPYDGKACDRGGVACLQKPSQCWMEPLNLFCCYAQCVCSSSPGIWDCSYPSCEGSDAPSPCEAGVPSGSSEGAVLADVGEWVRDLAIDGTRVYWLSRNGTIARVPMSDGGAAEKLVEPGPQDPAAEGFALDDQSLYWYAQSQIFGVPLSGGVARPLATSSDGITSLFTDTGAPDLYVGQKHAIAAIAKSGGALRPLYEGPASRPLGAVVTLAAGSLYFLDTEMHAVTPPADTDAPYAWQPWSSTSISRVRIMGGPAEPIVWMRGIYAVATNGIDTYWSNRVLASEMWQLRHVSPTAASILLTTTLRASVDWIAFDDSHVYYLERQQGCTTPIKRMSRSGGAPETVVYDATSGTRALLGSGKLFWMSGASSSVLRSVDL